MFLGKILHGSLDGPRLNASPDDQGLMLSSLLAKLVFKARKRVSSYYVYKMNRAVQASYGRSRTSRFYTYVPVSSSSHVFRLYTELMSSSVYRIG